VLRRDRRSAAVLMVAFYMYGGMVISIFPGDPGISFEYHAFGAMAGVACGFAFRGWDPRPPRRRYDWESEQADEEDDPVIGDQWREGRE
jgi:membrane associated rhomboid family serine protease